MTILVSSTEESTGKTAVALALATLAAERGQAVGYMKPKGTRLESNVGKTFDADPALARELLDIEAEMAELEPVVYSPTFIRGALRGQERPERVRQRVADAYADLAAGTDRMILEGGGTLETGGVVDLTDGDVAELLDAEVLLVARYRDESDVDAVLGAADRLGDRLRGVVFNAVPEGRHEELDTEVAPFLEGRGIPTLGILPRDPDLAGVSVQELSDELGADVLTEVPMDATVERFHVGAMSGESALQHLRRTRNAALITGGDRSDIQTVALEAPGVRCLVLSGGIRPAGAVLGRAAEAEVPVLLVQGDTATTIERAETILDSGRVRDAVTVGRVREMLHDHADLEAILAEG
ncbi:MAG: phosphotransacetylase family protein [Halobacteriaceae archaeon]